MQKTRKNALVECKINKRTRFDYNLWLSPATEFGTDDGSGDGYIEAFDGGALSRVGGNEESLADEGGHFGRNAPSLVAHDDDAVVGEFLCVDALPVEECAVDRSPFRWERF